MPVYLIRHGNAFARKGWPANEPDELRPMSKTGRNQARRLAEHLADVPFTRLVSSPFLRCIQTLEPFADARGLDITIARELSEAEPPSGAEAWVLATAADGPAALCTHGDIVRGLIDDLIERGVERADEPMGYRKGSAWRLDVLDGRVTAPDVPAAVRPIGPGQSSPWSRVNASSPSNSCSFSMCIQRCRREIRVSNACTSSSDRSPGSCLMMNRQRKWSPLSVRAPVGGKTFVPARRDHLQRQRACRGSAPSATTPSSAGDIGDSTNTSRPTTARLDGRT